MDIKFDSDKWQDTLIKTLSDAHKERLLQLKKWGPQKHDLPTWISILAEEVGELSAEVLKFRFDGVTSDDSIYSEAIQVAAVALAIAHYSKDKIS